MIALDTSSLRRYLEGENGEDVEAVAIAVGQRIAVLPPIVVTEITSDPKLQKLTIEAIAGLPLIPLRDGFWVRAGMLRSRIIASGRKARVADSLIAQCCIDHDYPLVTHDRDFRHFAEYGLKLM